MSGSKGKVSAVESSEFSSSMATASKNDRLSSVTLRERPRPSERKDGN
jgi:hypothetical protein